MVTMTTEYTEISERERVRAYSYIYKVLYSAHKVKSVSDSTVIRKKPLSDLLCPPSSDLLMTGEVWRNTTVQLGTNH